MLHTTAKTEQETTDAQSVSVANPRRTRVGKDGSPVGTSGN